MKPYFYRLYSKRLSKPLPHVSTHRCHLTEACVCDAGYIWDGASCIEQQLCVCDNAATYNETYRSANCDDLCYCYGMNRSLCVDVGGCGMNEECRDAAEGETSSTAAGPECFPVVRERETWRERDWCEKGME